MPEARFSRRCAKFAAAHAAFRDLRCTFGAAREASALLFGRAEDFNATMRICGRSAGKGRN
jgi:hypothetical protein